MIGPLDITDVSIAEKVLHIQLPAYQVEAELIGFAGIPQLKDTVETLSQCGEQFYGYYVQEELAGVISYKVEEDVLDICRLVVHPSYFRKGIANALLAFLLKEKQVVKKAIVSTGGQNIPAKNLYVKHGFVETKQIPIAEGIYLSILEK